MKNDRILLIVGILCLLGLGMVVGRLFFHLGRPTAPALGGGLWLTRRADLMVQLSLMFVGALGIRALLPGEGEEDEE